jgi:hypothetical protein
LCNSRFCTRHYSTRPIDLHAGSLSVCIFFPLSVCIFFSLSVCISRSSCIFFCGSVGDRTISPPIQFTQNWIPDMKPMKNKAPICIPSVGLIYSNPTQHNPPNWDLIFFSHSYRPACLFASPFLSFILCILSHLPSFFYCLPFNPSTSHLFFLILVCFALFVYCSWCFPCFS